MLTSEKKEVSPLTSFQKNRENACDESASYVETAKLV